MGMVATMGPDLHPICFSKACTDFGSLTLASNILIFFFHLRLQVEEDKAAGVNTVEIPPPGSERGSVVDAAVAVVNAQMDVDRKTTALKALQVFTHI